MIDASVRYIGNDEKGFRKEGVIVRHNRINIDIVHNKIRDNEETKSL